MSSIGLLAVFTAFLLFRFLTKRSGAAHPPGPKGLPIVGNLYDVPSSSEWLAYQRWAREFRTHGPCGSVCTVLTEH